MPLPRTPPPTTEAQAEQAVVSSDVSAVVASETTASAPRATTTTTTATETPITTATGHSGQDPEDNLRAVLLLLDVAVRYHSKHADVTAADVERRLDFLRALASPSEVEKLIKFVARDSMYTTDREEWCDTIKDSENKEAAAIIHPDTVVDVAFIVATEIAAKLKREKQAALRDAAHQPPRTTPESASRRAPPPPVTTSTPVLSTALFTTRKEVPLPAPERTEDEEDSEEASSISSDEDWELRPDPAPHLSFKGRVRSLEPAEACDKFYDTMATVAPSRSRFDREVEELAEVISRHTPILAAAAKKYYEEIDERIAALTTLYEYVKRGRIAAIEDFSIYTQKADSYLQNLHAQFLKIDSTYKKRVEKRATDLSTAKIKRQADPAAASRTAWPKLSSKLKVSPPPTVPASEAEQILCNLCASPPFLTPGALSFHKLMFHPNDAAAPPPPDAAAPPRPAVSQPRAAAAALRNAPLPLLPQAPILGAGHDVGGQPPNPPNNQQAEPEEDMRSVSARSYRAEDFPDERSVPQRNGGGGGDGSLAGNVGEIFRQFALMQEQQDERMSRQQQVALDYENRRMEVTQESNYAMLQMFAESNFDSSKLCPIFNPDKIQDKADIFREFQSWLSHYEEVEIKLAALRYSNIKKFTVLKKHVGGTALILIDDANPTIHTYAQAMERLRTSFLSQSLLVRQIIYKLATLSKMTESSSAVTSAVTLALSLMEQLERRNPTKDDLLFLLFSEAIEPKLPPSAKKEWDDIRQKNNDQTRPLGHRLTMVQLKQFLTDMKTRFFHKEFNSHLNRPPVANKQNDNKKKDNKANSSDSVFDVHGTEQIRETGMPKNGKGTCPIPGCNASLNGKKGHKYVLLCPVMKEMSSEDLNKWYNQMHCKCRRCFSTLHHVKDCHVPELKCEAVIKSGPEKGQVCHRTNHNKYLHTDAPPPRRGNNVKRGGGGAGGGGSGGGKKDGNDEAADQTKSQEQ